LEVAHDLFSKYPPRLLEEFKDDYERICDREKCNFENRKNFINKEDPVQLTRYNALLTIAGVGALGLAAFYALSNRVWMN
jgi:hypothetical protein